MKIKSNKGMLEINVTNQEIDEEKIEEIMGRKNYKLKKVSQLGKDLYWIYGEK
jgi:uncharacterized Fe-S cluster-containing radical SAM superfamily enzyme